MHRFFEAAARKWFRNRIYHSYWFLQRLVQISALLAEIRENTLLNVLGRLMVFEAQWSWSCLHI